MTTLNAVPGPGTLAVTTASDGVAVTVAVHGELLQETGASFVSAVAGLAEDTTVGTVVVDLTPTTFMDSTGLGTLVSLHNQIVERGGRFHLVRPVERVFRLFELTRLDTFFEFVEAR